MYNGLTLFNAASALAKHASARQSVIAQNVAHADTPGYQAMDLPKFSETYAGSGAGATRMKATRAAHLHGADPTAPAPARAVVQPGDASPNGNTVSIENEMLKGTQVRHQHDLATSVYRAGIDLLRAGLGRGR